ncbi:MAG: hypothetical protein J6S62_00670 [Bacteroidales bacterium]|nr:hypothetical protein [Bacteroidales bacterium]
MLRKLCFLAALMLLAGISAGAQEKIPSRKVVTSDYNRNSISMVAVQRGDSFDSEVTSAVKSFSPSQKFDVNNISTKTIRIRKSRDEAVSQSEMDEAVSATPFAREILSSIFNRDSQGMMDDKTVRYRGNYDAKDQDVINARASRVGTDALGDLGHALVKGSYVVLTDIYGIDRSVDRQGNVHYAIRSQAYAYKIGLGENGLSDFYEQCWIYDDDDDATRAAKRRAFQNLAIDMVPVAHATSFLSGSSVEDATESALSSLITALENRIPEWEVAVGIIATKPLRAKIGTKEGLTNGARYRAYSYSEDRSGRLKSVPRGFIRATTISSNTGMSIGATEPSEFYQISGLANIEEGWTIKQSNDAGIGIMPYVRVGGICTVSAGLDLDWLMKTTTHGSMQYLLATIGLDVNSNPYTAVNFGLGYGYALHLTRFFELMPYGILGLDHLGLSDDDISGDDSRFIRSSALMLEPGIRVAANVAYPLQVYAKVCADLLLPLGDIYKRYNESMEYYYNNNHHSGVGIQFGVKWTF